MSQSIFWAWWRDKTNPTKEIATAGTVSVGTSLTTVLRIDTRNLSRVMIYLLNGAVDFNAFEVHMRANQDQAASLIMMHQSSNWSAPDNIFLGITQNDNTGAPSAATDMTALPAAYSAMFGYEVRGIAEISLHASVASGSSLVRAYWGGN